MPEEKASAKAKKMLTRYVQSSLMDKFDSLPTVARLAVCQTVPKNWIASRDIGGKPVDYLEGWRAQKILNFIFNFNISTKIIDKSVKEYVQTTRFFDNKKKAWGQKSSNVYEATMQVYFKFIPPDGGVIEREFISTHKAFENNATAKDDCLKGALSKAWTLAAHSFGIASNIKGQWSPDVQPEEEPPVEETVAEITPQDLPY